MTYRYDVDIYTPDPPRDSEQFDSLDDAKTRGEAALTADATSVSIYVYRWIMEDPTYDSGWTEIAEYMNEGDGWEVTADDS